MATKKTEETAVAVPEKSSLYDLVTLSQEIQRKLFEAGGELTMEMEEEIIKLEKKLPSKVDGYKFIADDMRNSAAMWKKRSQEAAQVAKQFENYADKLDEIMVLAIERFGGDRIDGNLYYAKRQLAKSAVKVLDESKIADGHKVSTVLIQLAKNDKVIQAIVDAAGEAARKANFNPKPGWITVTHTVDKAKVFEDLKAELPVEGASLQESPYVKYYPNKGGKGGTNKPATTPTEA